MPTPARRCPAVPLRLVGQAFLGVVLLALAGEVSANPGGDRWRVELSPKSARVVSCGGTRPVDWRVAAGHGRCEERVWIDGRHEERLEQVWVEAREERVWVPAEHRIVRDPCGRERQVLVRPGHWRVLCIPGHHETVVRRVWVPGRWELRQRPWRVGAELRF